MTTFADPSSLLEARGEEGWEDTHELVTRRVGVDGVRLDHVGAVRGRLGARGVEQARRDAATALGALGEEADNRPHVGAVGIVVAAQLAVGLPRGDRAPRDRFALDVREDADGRAAEHGLFHLGALVRPAALHARGPRSPDHAPAVLGSAPPVEEGGHVGPAFGRDGAKLEVGRCEGCIGRFGHGPESLPTQSTVDAC